MIQQNITFFVRAGRLYTLKTGVLNNTPRCVLVPTKVCNFNTPFYLQSENTPRCAGKHINMCKKTHQGVYKNTPYFYTPFVIVLGISNLDVLKILAKM